MKITTLIEDAEAENTCLKSEHGLSMFIETRYFNILFDTGQSGDIIYNAEKLNVDLKKTDIIVLSHGHYDHCGGVKRLLETYDIKPTIITGREFFQKSRKYRLYSSTEMEKLSTKNKYKYIGIDFDYKYLENKNIKVKECAEKGIEKLSGDVLVFSDFEKFYNFENPGSSMMYMKDNEYIFDDFSDEICLGIRTEDGIIVLMGCAHPGFLNIIKTVEKRTGEKIIGVIGGTHLIKADEDRIKKSIDVLKSMDIKILGLSHCTGEKAFRRMREEFNDLFANKSGDILELK